MNLRARIRELANRVLGRQTPPVAAPWPHLLVPSPMQMTLSADRCFYCFAKQGTPAFGKPCPRRRPNYVELA